MKVPATQYDETVAFYRDVAGLPVVEAHEESVVFAFGPMQLWVDREEDFERVEIWLELATSDTGEAARRLVDAGAVRRDDVEKLPDDFDAFFIANPAGVIHLVANEEQA